MKTERRILILGDSIVEGDGSTDGRGWVGIFREKYWSKGIWITNLGIAGDTTSETLNRISAIYGYRSDIIVLAVGINDSSIPTKIDEQPVNSLEDFRANFDEIIHRCGQYGAEIKIIGLTRVDESRVQPFPGSKTGKSYYNQLIEKYDAELQGIAKDYNCSYISIAHVLSFHDLIDGLHPNNGGYEKLAKYLEPYILGV